VKIALITAFPPSRHALNEYGFHVAEQLRHQPGIELTILGDYLPEPAQELPGFHVIRCWGFQRPWNLATVMRAIRAQKPDVAWFNLGFASFGATPVPAILGLAAPAAARLAGVYSHVTLHQLFETVDLYDAGVTSPRLYRAGGWLATHLLLSASSLSVLLPAYRRTLDTKYRRGRVTARSHGIFAGKPEAPDFSQRGNPTHRILAFGKWGTYKRLELLIDAFHRVAETIPDVELIVGGGDHPKAVGYVESMARQHAHDPRLKFLGYVAEAVIPDLFRRASIAVMPYTSSAGSSGVAHLAAQYSVPVIASGIRDFRELADHEGIAMRFFTPGDRESLVETLLALLHSPREREQMAWQSHNAAIAMSMPRVIQDYVRSFRQHQRVAVLRRMSDLRRNAHHEGDAALSRSLGQRMQRWQDEDELTGSPFV